MHKKRAEFSQKSSCFAKKNKTPLWRHFFLSFAIFAVAACESIPSPSSPPPGPVFPLLPVPGADKHDGEDLQNNLNQQDSSVVSAVLLLPFSSPNAKARHEAASMLKAAELALFDSETDDLRLIPKDTQGTPQGAQQAFEEALKEGANLVLGPVLGRNVQTIAPRARSFGHPVLAFSSDATIAQPDIYLMGFPPEDEVHRLISYTLQQGMEHFALVRPGTVYGQRIAGALNHAIRDTQARLVGEKTYKEKSYVALQPIIASLAEGERPDALLLPERGKGLRLLASLVQDSQSGGLQLLGTDLWYDKDNLKEPALEGGIFPGPDPDAYARFEKAYRASYDTAPTRLAGLAYDAVTLAAFFARTSPDPLSWHSALQDRAGFYGVDGLFRFKENGVIERGLAIMGIQGGRFVVLDPAPKTFFDVGS